MTHSTLSTPFVRSRYDLTGSDQILVHHCQDCACSMLQAENPGLRPYRLRPTTDLQYDSSVIEEQLDDGFFALFNPGGSHGVVVVHPVVMKLLKECQTPIRVDTIDDIQGNPALREALEQLCALDILSASDRACDWIDHSDDTLTAWLHITTQCNLDCAYCYIRKANVTMSESTGRAAVRSLVRSAGEHGYSGLKLKYSGGEASLHYPLVFALHDFARELTSKSNLHFDSILLSNGVKFPDELIVGMRERDMRVMISLDGIGQAHDSQRPFAGGCPTFKHVEETLNRLADAGISPHISITVTARNMNALPDTVRFVLDRDLLFSLNFVRQTAAMPLENELRCDPQSMIHTLETVCDIIEARLPAWSMVGSIFDRAQLAAPSESCCGRGQNYVAVDCEGRIARCPMELEHTLGDIFEDDPVRMIQSPAENDALSHECEACTWRLWCAGGCPLSRKADAFAGAKSPYCEIYRAMFPKLIRLEGMRIRKHPNRIRDISAEQETQVKLRWTDPALTDS